MPIQTKQQLENFLLPPGSQIPHLAVNTALTKLTERLAGFITELQENTEGITLEEFARLPQVVGMRDDIAEVANALESALTERPRGSADLHPLFIKK